MGNWYGQMSMSVVDGDMVNTLACANCEISLSDLTQDEHTLEIKATATAYWNAGISAEIPEDVYGSVSFFVNLGVVPVVFVSGLSQFEDSQAEFNITTDCSDAVVCYCLDGLENVTLSQSGAVVVSEGFQYNVTLSDLADGEHTLTAYATDSLNNTGTATHNFTINTATPTAIPTLQQELPLTALIAGAAIAATVIAAICLLLYRKRKH